MGGLAVSIFNDDITPQAKDRLGSARDQALGFDPTGVISLGIDPGARYTALVVRDGDAVLHATTITRDKDQEPIPYAREVVARLTPIVNEYKSRYPNLVIGIEGVTDPKGFNRGKRAAINPAGIVRTGVTAGALAIALPEAVIVPPGGSGSLHTSHYPPELQGRRPATLEGNSNGAGTRRHEQSAYDIAGKALIIHAEATQDPNNTEGTPSK